MYMQALGIYMVYTWYIPCIIFIGVPDEPASYRVGGHKEDTVVVSPPLAHLSGTSFHAVRAGPCCVICGSPRAPAVLPAGGPPARCERV